MAGNVKEWCWNKSEGDRRFILGGTWNEPAYMFHAHKLRHCPSHWIRVARQRLPLYAVLVR